MFGHPVKLNVKRLLSHLIRDESGQEVLDDFLGQAREDIEGRHVEDFSPTVVGVSMIHKWSCGCTDEFTRMTPTRMVR